MAYSLGNRSKSNLAGVNADLVRVVERAIQITDVDFTVIEGLRTKERQVQLFKDGKTRTMNSRHIIGQAVDVIPYPVDWNDTARFRLVAKAIKQAASELDVKITWGGDWKSFVDMPHYQIEV
ncbi:DD-transpeptidase [Shewanella sp. phage 3/49]|uniref:endolysin n=1 Tax=Shewanella sp. phage 3/49 TaxID=1458863 RepID=UPI0004F6F4A6|nr:endolysin [Shewanella sp. phage 3/49]AHK11836.1 DD-transpeptidase [Shewanella sp. phage 3/49]